MWKDLISLPVSAMDVPAEDLGAVGEAARAVIREAKQAGDYVFGGGIEAGVAPVRVAADGSVTSGTSPQTREFDGGFCVLELPPRDAAVRWAAKIAGACRCEQELREFGYDPKRSPASGRSRRIDDGLGTRHTTQSAARHRPAGVAPCAIG
jgi:hypothetical protein